MQQEIPLRLSQLMDQLRRVVAMNFPQPLWLNAEIAQARESRGHLYIHLVEKDTETDTRLAQADAVLWQNRRTALEAQAGQSITDLLREGHEVRIKVRVELHPVHGLKLVMEDIDLRYAMGQMMLRRRQILEALQRSGLLDRQRRLEVPAVVQRIAVISSGQAAGWQDFREQLLHNAWELKYDITLFTAAMQGASLEVEVGEALRQISKASTRFDVAVLIRGGGSKLDLAWFDNQALAERIAGLPIPLLTGIGHDMDETVTDLVAWKALKTPTAVAAWLLDHNLAFEARLLDLGQRIARAAKQFIQSHHHRLDQTALALNHSCQRRIDQERWLLSQGVEKLTLLGHSRLERETERLNHCASLLRQLDPASILGRGYSITLYDGKPMLSAENIPEGSRIETVLARGHLFSITEKHEEEN
jgi:exodeoxyribonuclease VII large subunit